MKNTLIIDDDKVFCEVLGAAFAKRDMEVRTAMTGEEAIRIAEGFNPEYVVLDLKIHRESGLALIPKLLQIDPYTRIVILTGYANVATAVEAIKLGAVHYLAKPVAVEEIIDAFDKTDGNPDMPIESGGLSMNALEWQHIRSTLEQHQGNISATARALKMHRRTLQRKLDKMPKI